MKPLRFHLAGAMAAVAALALNLGVIRLLLGGTEEELLYRALPMANLLAAVGIAAICRPRLRSFAIGFMIAGVLSLVTFLAWVDENPWTFLHYFEPPLLAIDQFVEAAFPSGRFAILYAIMIAIFAVPHAVVGLAAGSLTARAWSLAVGPRIASG